MLRGKITYRLLASLIAALSMCTTLSAQSTRVRGRVTDAASGAPMQFVSVVFPGTTTGITTDEEGIYTLETRDTVGRVQASMVGYATQTKPLTRGGFNQVDFALEAVEFGIGSVVITPGENPAHPILKGVVRRKPQNNPDEYERYHCATYTKMELDLTNVKPRFRNKRLQRNFGFIFEYIDTSALTGQAYLPAMISETTADFYHSKRNPSLSREIIRANRVSGVEDSFAIAQFTGQMHGNVNFYANFIDIFNVRFASPLSDGGLFYYDYFLVDSMQVDGRKTYKIRFHPKRLTSPVLDGEVNIDSASYALQSASARMPSTRLRRPATVPSTSGAGWSACRYAQSIIKVAEDSAPMASASSGHESSTSKTRSSCSLTRVRPHEMLPARPVSFMSSTVTCSSRWQSSVWPMQSWNSRPESPRHRCLAIAGTR